MLPLLPATNLWPRPAAIYHQGPLCQGRVGVVGGDAWGPGLSCSHTCSACLGSVIGAQLWEPPPPPNTYFPFEISVVTRSALLFQLLRPVLKSRVATAAQKAKGALPVSCHPSSSPWPGLSLLSSEADSAGPEPQAQSHRCCHSCLSHKRLQARGRWGRGVPSSLTVPLPRCPVRGARRKLAGQPAGELPGGGKA